MNNLQTYKTTYYVYGTIVPLNTDNMILNDTGLEGNREGRVHR